MKKTVLILTSLLCSVGLMAKTTEYLIEINPTKKIIHLEHLGVGENTAILDALQTMPELLGRASADGSTLSNFSIQVDGKDVGQSRDVVLEQTIVAEVDVVEISTSPTVSEQKNGTGGVINIKLKPISTEGVSGMALMDASTEWDVQPSVLLNYKKDKFQLRSSFRAEYYRPTDYGYGYYTSPDSMIDICDTTYASYKQETAKLFMTYAPTGHDQLKVNIWESYAREHKWSDISTTMMLAEAPGSNTYHKSGYSSTSDKHNEGLTAEAYMGYSHNYYSHSGGFNVEAQYSYMPAKTVDKSNTSLIQAHQVAGEIDSKHMLYKTDKNKIELKYGMNMSYSFGHSFWETRSKMDNAPALADTTENDNTKLYASPFVELKMRFGKWYLLAGGRYQYYRVNIVDRRTTSPFTDNNTFTGNVSVRYVVAKDHLLRLNLARNIQRKIGVDYINIFPYYDADLLYIFEWEDTQNAITMSIGTNYIYAQQNVGYTGTMCANVQLIYQHGIFSMAFAGNSYVRTQYENPQAGKRCWYYNISLLPVLSFSRQWTLSGKLVYNSRMETFDEEYGDCVYTQIRVAKQIHGWNIHLELDDIFDYTTYNTLFMNNGVSYTDRQDLYKRCLKVGFSYTF